MKQIVSYHLSVYSSVCLSVCLSVCISILTIYLSTIHMLFVCLFTSTKAILSLFIFRWFIDYRLYIPIHILVWGVEGGNFENFQTKVKGRRSPKVFGRRGQVTTYSAAAGFM